MVLSSGMIHQWLTHEGSLTEKLKAACNQDVHLDVLRHEWSSADTWDTQKLGLLAGECVLHREIIMRTSQHACWYARTVLPETTYQADASRFSRLKTHALGELIWQRDHIQRTLLTPYTINKADAEYHFLSSALHHNNDTLWARLSTWTVYNTHVFYLLEIFLPDLKAYCA